MGEIVMKNICKAYGNVKVIEDLNLHIKDGEFAVLVGASGCGKTTLLRIIAGIGPATSGELYFDGEEVSDLPPGKRDIAMVFQNYAIYPTMKVRENIEFGLRNRGVRKEERKRLIEEVSKKVGLEEYLNRKPSELSGGQRQRVALARAMVKNPSIFLMDEPLSNLDAKLRVSMRSELIELHHQMKTTFVYVTHDQAEAMSMADTIILMDGGKIQQQGSPEEIYNDPNSVFVAQFIGTPPMNVLPLQDKQIGYRPEKMLFSREPVEDAYVRKARIVTREMLGSETLYKLWLEDATLPEEKRNVIAKLTDHSFAVDDSIWLHVATEDLYFFNADGQRIRRGDDCDYDALIAMAGGK